MISISKPKQAPSVLTGKGVAKRDEHCAAYLADTAKYCSGELKFSFSDSIYNHKTVKAALVKAQYSKCCFCESLVGLDGDVEHFRPKSAVSEGASNTLTRPGYYWLAYDWDNLLLSCSACNSRNKRSAFPLEDTTQRARTHTADYKAETPIFINPAEEDPEKYISFRQEIPYAIDGNEKGTQTIEGLGLDREILNVRRADHLKELKVLRTLVNGSQAIPTKFKTSEFLKGLEAAEKLLANCAKDNAEFAGMARAAGFNRT